jgi:hypothetical protein
MLRIGSSGGCYEHDNELSKSIKDRKFVDHPNDYQFLKKYFVP